MKNKTLTIMLATLAIAAASAVAAPSCTISTAGGAWPQSPYTVNRTGDLSQWDALNITSDFSTFCIQSDVVFALNTTYYASIGDTIQTPNIALADTTKKLYAAYLNSALDGYNANMVQVTIWESLDMAPLYSTPETSFLSDFVANMGDYDITGWQHVKVLNLWENANLTGDVQSQLVMVTPIPAPGAILLGGIGTSLVGWLRRRNSM